MRNLKRALSLALASVMLLGMMVVGSSAAQSYTDVDYDNDNVEAIEVLQAVKVMNGDADSEGNLTGEFRPTDKVKRSEMARIMAELLKLDYEYYEAIPSQFTDVTGNYAWAKKYVDACAANGIIAGRGNGIYDPGAEVTAIEAAAMMMRALGYFQSIEDNIGGFEAATVKQASQIGLFSGVGGNATDSLNRNQVAQLALNTLEANMVYFSGDPGFELNGVKVGYRSEYSIRKGTEPKYRAISELGDATTVEGTNNAQGQWYINLGEELYDGDLRRLENTTDDFRRPATEWRYKGELIGVYVDEEDVFYTKAVKVGDIYKDLGLNRTIPVERVSVFVDGVEDSSEPAVAIRNGDNDNDYGARGVLTQVYYDKIRDRITITEINTWTGEIIRTVPAKDSRDTYILIAPEGTGKRPASASASGVEFDTNVEFEDDLRVLYTYSEWTDQVIEVAEAEYVSGNVTKTENKNTDKEDGRALTLDNDRYAASAKLAGMEIEEGMLGYDYTIYLDFYGYMIYVEEGNIGVGNYALMINTATPATFIGNRARLLFADGTIANVATSKNYNDANSSDHIPNYTIVTFREDSSGEYTLRPVEATQSFMNVIRTVNDGSGGTYVSPDDATALGKDADLIAADYAYFKMETNKANIYVNGGAKQYDRDKDDSNNAATGHSNFRANSASTFVVADKKATDLASPDGNSSSFSVYTGIKNAPTIMDDNTAGTPYRGGGSSTGDDGVAAYWYCKGTNSNMITVMFIFPGKDAYVKGANRNFLYVASASVSDLISDKSRGQYYTYNAIVGKEIIEDVMIDGEVVIDNSANSYSDGLFYDVIPGGTTSSFPSSWTNSEGTVYDSVTAVTKARLCGIFQSYTTDKDGVVTGLAEYDAFTNGDELQLLVGAGIDKRSQDYTVIITPNGSSSKQTITVDEDAAIYYVDDDGKISEWSYSKIHQDDDDTIYAVVEDGMVQVLVIEETSVAIKTDVTGITPDVEDTDGETSGSVIANSDFTLTASFSGGNPNHERSYQWYSKSAVDPSSVDVSGWTKLPGKTHLTETFKAPKEAGKYKYMCVMTVWDGKNEPETVAATYTLTVTEKSTTGTTSWLISTVNSLLASGQNVTVPANWAPADKNSEAIVIPEGRTLTVEGGLNLTDSTSPGAWVGVKTLNATAKPGTLKVNGTLIVGSQDTLDCIVDATNMRIKRESNYNILIKYNVTVDNTLTIDVTDAKFYVNLGDGSTYKPTVKTTILENSSNAENRRHIITIKDGSTLKVGPEYPTNGQVIGNVQIINDSADTLEVTGLMKDCDLNIGDSGSGRTIIHTMEGGTLTLKKGTLTITGTTFKPQKVDKSAVSTENKVDITFEQGSETEVSLPVMTQITGFDGPTDSKDEFEVKSTAPAEDLTSANQQGPTPEQAEQSGITAVTPVYGALAMANDATVKAARDAAAGKANESDEAEAWTKAVHNYLRNQYGASMTPIITNPANGGDEIIKAYNLNLAANSTAKLGQHGADIGIWWDNSGWAFDNDQQTIAIYDSNGKLVAIDDHSKRGSGGPLKLGWLSQTNAGEWNAIFDSDGSPVAARNDESVKVLDYGKTYTYIIYSVDCSSITKTSTLAEVTAKLKDDKVLYTGILQMPAAPSTAGDT